MKSLTINVEETSADKERRKMWRKVFLKRIMDKKGLKHNHHWEKQDFSEASSTEHDENEPRHSGLDYLDFSFDEE